MSRLGLALELQVNLSTATGGVADGSDRRSGGPISAPNLTETFWLTLQVRGHVTRAAPDRLPRRAITGGCPLLHGRASWLDRMSRTKADASPHGTPGSHG